MRKDNTPIIIGRISGVYGVKGWLKIHSYTRPKKNILDYLPWLVKLNDAWQEIGTEKLQWKDQTLLVKISSVDTPETARKFTRCDLAVMRERLPSLGWKQYYWYDLIGLEVLNQEGVSLGKIKTLIETGANDVLVINDDKDKILIPFIKGVYIKDVDLQAGFVQVEWQ